MGSSLEQSSPAILIASHSFIHSGFTQMFLCLENVMVKPSFTSLIRMAVSVPIPCFFLYSTYCNLLSHSPTRTLSPHLNMACFIHYHLCLEKCLTHRRHSLISFYQHVKFRNITTWSILRRLNRNPGSQLTDGSYIHLSCGRNHQICRWASNMFMWKNTKGRCMAYTCPCLIQ